MDSADTARQPELEETLRQGKGTCAVLRKAEKEEKNESCCSPEKTSVAEVGEAAFKLREMCVKFTSHIISYYLRERPR